MRLKKVGSVIGEKKKGLSKRTKLQKVMEKERLERQRGSENLCMVVLISL